jgi:16S rRNA processing protein RimM
VTDFAVVGRIRKPHGIRGDLVVEGLCDEPEAIFAAGRRIFLSPIGPATAPTEMRITSARPFKEGWIVALHGLSDRNEVESWRGREFLVPDDELSPPSDDELWLHEIVGSRVVQVDGTAVGEVVDLFEVPQGLLLDVRTARGVVSIPFVEAIVVGVDRPSRTLTIDPPDGLLEL